MACLKPITTTMPKAESPKAVQATGLHTTAMTAEETLQASQTHWARPLPTATTVETEWYKPPTQTARQKASRMMPTLTS